MGLGFCPIGRVDESTLAGLLSFEPGVVLQGFIGGAIDESQLRELRRDLIGPDRLELQLLIERADEARRVASDLDHVHLRHGALASYLFSDVER